MANPPCYVLLVEDDPAHAELLERAFEPRGSDFRLKRARSLGDARVQLARGALPQLILTDMRLPDGDGLDLIAYERAGQRIPIVIMTSFGNEEFAVEAMKAGAIDYVVKSDATFPDMPHIVERSIRVWEHMNEARRAEKALRESEERLRTLFENSPLGLYRTTPDGKFLFANPAMVRLVGFNSFEELAKHNIETEGYDPEYPRARFKEIIERDGRVKGMETSWRRSDGKRIFVREYAEVIRGEDGQVLYYEGTVEDITERKLAELEAQKQTQNLNSISELAIELAESSSETDIFQIITRKINDSVEALATTISVYQPAESCLLLKNYTIRPGWVAKIQKLIGKELIGLKVPVTPETKEQLLSGKIGKMTSLSELTFNAIPSSVGQAIQRLLNIGEMIAIVLQFKGELIGSIVVYLAKDSPAAPVDMLQAMAHVVAVALRRKRAEDELRANEERFRSLVQNSYDIITVLDEHGLIRYESPSICRVLGYDEGSLVGKNAFDFIHADDLPAMIALLGRALNEGLTSASFEFRFRHANGAYVYLEGAGNNLLTHPQIQGIVITSRNISERKRADKELQRVNRALRATSDCNQALVRAESEQDLLESICRTIVEVGEYRLAWIGYVKSDPELLGIDLIVQYGSGDSDLPDLSLAEIAQHELPADLYNTLHAFQPVVIRDLANDARLNGIGVHALQRGLRSVIIFPLALDGQLLGVLLIYSEEADAFDAIEIGLLSEMVADMAFGIQTMRARADRKRTDELLERTNRELAQAYDATLEGWSRALELREQETANHGKRVVDLTLALAQKLGIPAEDWVSIRRGALLHDIGKMGIPDAILMKPGTLTAEEWVQMRRHPDYAYRLLVGIPYLAPSIDIPYYHHERWDGSGYPRGLKGKEIPLVARLFSVVDVWDALSHTRPYRPAWSEEDVRAYLKENAGVLFDPEIVAAFLEIAVQT
jgi:PAS domain S-box-containing protein/putative nucleotidyltransferase with HDIG domain